MQYAIKVSNLSKQFKIRKNKGLIKGLINPNFKLVDAVNDISFSIQPGESVAFLDPNGAGKTTTTKMMAGLIYPTQGQVEVLGFTPYDRKYEFLSNIGLVMGNKAGLNWDLTANQSFDLLKNIYNIDSLDFSKRLKELCEILDVAEFLDRQLRTMSLGERMKMEIIGSLLHKPDVLFLDEPTIGLDIITKKNIRNFLRNIQREYGTTLILTSHDMDDVETVCDRVIVINKGKLITDEDLKTLTSRYRKFRFVRLFFEQMPDLNAYSDLGEILEKNSDSILVKVEDDRLVNLISLATNQDLQDLHIESLPLEEIIAEIFKQ